MYKIGLAALVTSLYACGESLIDPSGVQQVSLEGNNVAVDDTKVADPDTVVPTGTDAFAIGGSSQPVITRLANSVQISFNVTAAGAPVTANFTTDLSSVVSNLNTVTAVANPASLSLAANETKVVTVTLATTYGAPSIAAASLVLTGTSTGFSKAFSQPFTIEPEVRFAVSSSIPSVWDLDALGGTVALRNNHTNLKVYLVNNTPHAHQFHVNPTTYHSNNLTAAGMAYMFTIPSLANQASIAWYFHGNAADTNNNDNNTVQARFTNLAPIQ